MICALRPTLLLVMCCGCSLVRTSIDPADGLPLAGALDRFDHSEFDSVAERFVSDSGRVDYTALQNDAADLNRYYAKIALFSPDSHSELFSTEDAKLAYWINAYNASVLVTVLRYYPIGSVSDVKAPLLLRWLPDRSGFFLFQGLTFGGTETSLYYLEHSVIRKRFKDPRIHFALNCASLGCPRLPRSAFSSDDIDNELAREARLFCNEDRNVRIDDGARKIVLSSIFEWYEDDFLDDYRVRSGAADADILDAVSGFLTAERRARLQRSRAEYTIEYSPYDWGLNDRAPPVTASH